MLLPARCCRAARFPAASAAVVSKESTRPSSFSVISRSNADSSRRRRREGASSSIPARISNTVTAVVQIDSAGWPSSHATTVASGSARMSAERTFVSSAIIRHRSRRHERDDRGSLAGPRRLRRRGRASLWPYPDELGLLRRSGRRGGGFLSPPPQWSGRALSPFVGVHSSRRRRADVPTVVPSHDDSMISSWWVETMGLEPTTSCVQSRRSRQLSYVPDVPRRPGTSHCRTSIRPHPVGAENGPASALQRPCSGEIALAWVGHVAGGPPACSPVQARRDLR